MTVEHKRLGKKGVLVSNICLGTMNFGWLTSKEDSFRIMDRALELGINFFDTADAYGRSKSFDGCGSQTTEEIIGEWFAQGGGRRDAVILATKVYPGIELDSGRPEPNSNTHSLSAPKIKKHCDASLKRLQTDWIDLYQIHHIDRSCPWDEVWQAFDVLSQQGKIVYTGSSNFAGWHIATACQEAAKRGMMGLASEQSVYNLNNRTIELEVIPACREYGLGLIPWSPLSGGLLAGVLEKDQSGNRRMNDWVAQYVKEHRERMEGYESLCREIGHPPAEVALAWLLHNPVVTAPIVGPRTMEQLESAVRATEIVLEKEIMDRLDKLFPGPGGEAPESYCGW